MELRQPGGIARPSQGLLRQRVCGSAVDSADRANDMRLIPLDFDSTCDRTPGGQQLSLFNASFETSCYPPILRRLGFDQERAQ